ncbi:winged helix-turn-helix transcriptional regulator [Streptomyces sp. NRRL F-2664]|uniref:winged helix-turn-helix transcriptional regulator n=1 Tax=Streptomyces sp. NRRL F-2664 TaxID=1463842 RepID=UPI00068A9676|nr:winged-helix domain-containing protein [Streptomyces sp. NRRL F-2664]
MDGTELQVYAECREFTTAFLTKAGVTASTVDAQPLDPLAQPVPEAKHRPPAPEPAPALPPAPGRRKARVLLIEDDPGVRAALAKRLSEHHYTVLHEASGSAGLRTANKQRPDLILLDLGLPDIDGAQVLTRLRTVSDVPVIVVTARDDVGALLQGWSQGADDYLVKPVRVAELLARMDRVLRRRSSPEQWAEGVWDDGLIRLVSQSSEASVAGTPLQLTRTEFRVLDLLVRNSGVVQPSEKLLARAWEDVDSDTEKVKSTISRLRRKLEATAVGSASIVSARGIGYFYRAPEPSAAVPAGSGASSARVGYGHAANILSHLEARPADGDHLQVGSLHIQLSIRQVRVSGTVIELTTKQFDLLALLARRQGEVVTREQLLDSLWPGGGFELQRSLQVHVASLRSKLDGASRIEKIDNLGYRIVPAPR